jgi:3D (Asp-Asp-Asp) domain-containing protein
MMHLNMSQLMLLAVAVNFARADTITAYCHCRICTPGSGITASGLRPVEGTTIAGLRCLPLGTRVVVTGVGTFIVQDRMSKRHEGGWDIYKASHRRAKDFGKQEVRVELLQSPFHQAAGPGVQVNCRHRRSDDAQHMN